MAAIQIHSCRLYCNTVAPRHSVALFSIDSVRAGTQGWLSSILDLSVNNDDSLSQRICRPCYRKFIAAESFRSTARISYKRKYFGKLFLHSSPKPPPVETKKGLRIQVFPYLIDALTVCYNVD